ncbi:MAG TPA: hypothetical protein VFW12_06865 [Candidatus Limnocylindria bacterium]|nr:hypothetical protein [Candidatus Limnocylindria bacterium]
MDTTRTANEDLLDIARALLLLQGAILLATTIEALVWGTAFGGSARPSFLLSAASAAVILVARVRIRAGRAWSRRLVYAVEGLILATLAIDAVLAVALTQSLPPLVALLTRSVLPVSVIALLRRAARATRPSAETAQLALEWGS